MGVEGASLDVVDCEILVVVDEPLVVLVDGA